MAAAASTINKFTTFMKLEVSRRRGESYDRDVVAMAKLEAQARAQCGHDHKSHIKGRNEKSTASKKEKRANAVAKGRGLTVAALSVAGGSILPEKAQALVQNNNKETMDLNGTCPKSDLIQELEMRGAGTYEKVKLKSSATYGLPVASVGIAELKQLLLQANNGNHIVERLATGSSSSSSSSSGGAQQWRRNGI